MKKTKERIQGRGIKGITLIALVITIIVLLILAGVSIATLTGETGILAQAADARLQTEIAQEKEAIALAYNAVLAKTEKDVTSELLNIELAKDGTKAAASGTGTLVVQFTETGRKYNIDSNGNIIGPIDGDTEEVEMNEFGFYFERLYVEDIGNGTKMGYVFHYENEIPTAEMYSDMGLGGDLYCVGVIESGLTYENKKVTIMDGDTEVIVTISPDGLSGTTNTGLTATCDLEQEIHGIYKGEVYKGTMMDNGQQVVVELIIGSDLVCTMNFKVNNEIVMNQSYEIIELIADDHLAMTAEGPIPASLSVDGRSMYCDSSPNDFILSIDDQSGGESEGVTNPYDANGWVTAWTYSRDTATWTEIATGGTASGDIVAKLYAVPGSTNHMPPSFSDMEYEFTAGQEYNLVIEGTGEMPDLENSKTAWQLNTLLGSAFYGGANMNAAYITEVYICDGIENIGAYSFNYFNSLKKVNISSGVTKIGAAAFSNCISLTDIDIPSGVTVIGESAFNSCSSLASINIPSGITSIEDYTFYACSTLTKLELPTIVTNIGISAFDECTNLQSINIPTGVTSIGENAFEDCSNLQGRITIPSGVTEIGGSTFEGCSNLSEIVLHNNITSIGQRAFNSCSSLTSINIPTEITSIEAYTFEGCSNLISVTIPEKVISIGYNAFNNCSNLKTVTILGDVTNLSGGMFTGIAQDSSIYVINPTVKERFWSYHYDEATTTIKIIGT